MFTQSVTLGSIIAGVSLIALALFHSWLGEKHVLGPLLCRPAFPELAIGTLFGKRVLRLAWHLTSLAWLALAYLLLRGACEPLPVALFLAVSGALTYGISRGRHFAWAVFMLGALGAAASGGSGTSWHALAGLFAGSVLAVIGCLHVCWAFGVATGLGGAVPEEHGRPLFTPPPLGTLLVALAMFAAAWLTLALAHWVPAPLPASWLWPAGIIAALVFAARTIGDLRFVGLFKRVRGSRFARLDDALFTPTCFALCSAIVMQLI